MQTWNNIDKSKWKRGPWDAEPDKAQWIVHGLDCLIVRGPAGALCGYVGVPPSHPYFDKGYGDCVVPADEHDSNDPDYHYECTPEGRLSVHGGLTFSDRCGPGDDPAHGICHTDENAANKIVWWFGFDCAHYGDIAPAFEPNPYAGSVYRDLAYVKSEVESLAQQLSAVR